MIILDTNVLSALMRRELELQVLSWLDHLPAASIWTTVVNAFEIRFGLELLPQGRRRRKFEEEFTSVIRDDLEGRVLPLDSAAADADARIGAKQCQAGRSDEIRDIQIAGIALSRRATLATRNTRHFEGIGLTLVDPWSV